ncbi:hypothetical protein [Xanthomonas phaseoli]|uniref:Uncharacterized protein n=1 Tax=Xanthomonas manihotis TaxID=43353 RepID=A0A8I1XHM3_XANMN|nr:hypothetical protein [Xanthomonas phaseoli]KUF37589.1 hypothetical protein AO826_00205 [Xanthomonas phaseoli pv. manihotis]MBO9721005.1 hypothetical protein [Xanthomonas phaseoli pv. manihotis]MBO9757191.1 hypothetical protein [Xanthomonas phaseoli pv. manihotis]MBO9758093.1 hypothetical protein [Xanthomonas phaseoli pv. manihotis]MBO9762258.1 hypothetical protein [Xanthomonas phaseoli pv. manihotis]
MQRLTVALASPAIASARGSESVQPFGRRMTPEQRRHMAGRCATASAVASVIFTFMRTVRFSSAPRIA